MSNVAVLMDNILIVVLYGCETLSPEHVLMNLEVRDMKDLTQQGT
jgi:hypothetical protein